MFAKSSRYEGIKHVEGFGSNGTKVSAVFLRRILLKDGELTNVKETIVLILFQPINMAILHCFGTLQTQIQNFRQII